jgi:hypothetical protein
VEKHVLALPARIHVWWRAKYDWIFNGYHASRAIKRFRRTAPQRIQNFIPQIIS